MMHEFYHSKYQTNPGLFSYYDMQRRSIYLSRGDTVIFRRASEFLNLLSAKRISDHGNPARRECAGNQKKLASEMITSMVGALKRRVAPSRAASERFQEEDEGGKARPGSPSTSSRANPCIMERSSRGHRSCTRVRFSPLYGM